MSQNEANPLGSDILNTQFLRNSTPIVCPSGRHNDELEKVLKSKQKNPPPYELTLDLELVPLNHIVAMVHA